MTLTALLPLLSVLFVSALGYVPVEPECRPQTHFCLGGLANGNIPNFWPSDSVVISVLSKRRDVLTNTPMKKTMLTLALALRSVNTGHRYTLSWSPKSNYYDTAVPRIVAKKGLVWCDQAATCVQPGVNVSAWDSIIDLGTVNGEQFNLFGLWLKQLNNTQIYQHPFLVIKGLPINRPNIWIGAYDSTLFTLSAIGELKSLEGTKFKNVSMTVDVYSIISEKPKLLGDAATIMKKDRSLFKDIVDFYTDIQATTEFFIKYLRRIAFWWKVHVEGKFYHYVGGQYYRLNVKKPYFDVMKVPFSVYGN